jgi:hypothetical protein
MKKSDVIEHEKAWRSYYANLEATAHRAALAIVT